MLFKPFFFFILLFVSSFLQAQNLVPNPSFEEKKSCLGFGDCPAHPGEICIIEGWGYPSLTPDYFNQCDSSRLVSVPQNIFGVQAEEKGNDAYVGLFTKAVGSSFPNYREILGIAFADSLVIGQKYFLSFKTSLADSANCSSNNIGLLCTTSPISYSFPVTLPNRAHLYSTPIIEDTASWTIISGSIIADSAYKYLFIGNFFDDFNTDTLMRKGIHPCNPSYCPDSNICHAYYYVDDICVSADSLECNLFTGIRPKTNRIEIKIHPNPADRSINISLLHQLSLLRIYDAFGREVYVSTHLGKDLQINTSSFSSGIYFLQVQTKSESHMVKFFIQ